MDKAGVRCSCVTSPVWRRLYEGPKLLASAGKRARITIDARNPSGLRRASLRKRRGSGASDTLRFA